MQIPTLLGLRLLCKLNNTRAAQQTLPTSQAYWVIKQVYKINIEKIVEIKIKINQYSFILNIIKLYFLEKFLIGVIYGKKFFF